MRPRKNSGTLFVVSAPSGTGKTTLCKQVLSVVPDLSFSVSFTTRQPRPGEMNDRDYTFVTRGTFESLIEAGEFLEWAEVYGELYGTSRRRIEAALDAGRDIILDIDIQGARQIRENRGEGVFIFILPPSLDVLRHRLEQRMTDSPEKIAARLRNAAREVQAYREYDYVIINDNLEAAVRELAAVFIAQRTRAERINRLWIEEQFLSKEGS